METNINQGTNVHPIRPSDTSGGPTGSYQNIERESWKGMAENLYSDLASLWSKESELIRAEMNEKITDAKSGIISAVAGGVVLFVGLQCLAAFAIIALDLALPLWVAALTVTAAFMIVGGIMLSAAKKKLDAEKLKPRRSVDAFGEIQTTLKEKVNEFRTH